MNAKLLAVATMLCTLVVFIAIAAAVVDRTGESDLFAVVLGGGAVMAIVLIDIVRRDEKKLRG